MDELRNGFHFHKPIYSSKENVWTNPIADYKNRERCSKYNKQMQHTRIKEQLVNEKQQIIVVDDE